MMNAIGDIFGALANNWMATGSAVLLFFVAYWWVDEKDNADGPSDAIMNVGERASDAVGMWTGAISALAVVMMTILIGLGQQLAYLAGFLTELIANAPVIAGELFVTLVGAMSISGVLNISMVHFVLIGVVTALVGYGWHNRASQG